MGKRKSIRKKCVLIIGSGSTIIKYEKKIKNFIKKNNPITIGCNHISDFIIPDYHFWGDMMRFIMFGETTSRNSFVIFSNRIPYNIRKKYKKIIKNFDVIKFKSNKPKEYDHMKGAIISIKYKKRILYSGFRTVGCLALFYAYIKGASKISVVGMDGYTLYPQKDIDAGIKKQHCYNDCDKIFESLPSFYQKYKNTGYTDILSYYSKEQELQGEQKKRKSTDVMYSHNFINDRDNYNNLYALQNYGVKFTILTPTVFKEFYDPSILNIK